MSLNERLQNRYVADGDQLAGDALRCLKACERVLADVVANPTSKAAQKRAADLLKKLRA